MLSSLGVAALVACGPATTPPVSPTATATVAVVTASVAPTPTRTNAATASASPTIAPTPRPTPTVARTITPTPAPTLAPTPPPATAAYCAIGDVLTPDRDYADTTRTYLDWTHTLPETYVPPDLVSATTGATLRVVPRAVEAVGAAEVLARRGDPSYTTLLTDDPKAAVRSMVYADLAALRTAADQAGNPVVILSAYRSYNLQRLTFDYWVGIGGYEQALRTSARPGHSEHQLGTAIDFGDGTAAPWEYADWATTQSGAWLAQHAVEYGFVLSYPRGKTPVTCYDYEPWHYRWVGKALAARVAASTLTLREHQANLPR